MKVVAIEGAFGLEHLRLVQRPDPEPGPAEVLLRMRAVSLNFRDLRMVKGQYNPKQALPLVPCSDGVGEVIAVGPGVTRVAVGDRVAPIFSQAWIGGPPTRGRVRATLGGPLDGTLAEQMVLSEQGVVKLPAYLSDAEAACLPCAAVTAWSALVTEGGVTAGDTVLVQGSGGVSLFALQIARLLGARVIATSSSDAKLERMRELGAEAGINYRATPQWGRAARELAGGEGVDHVVEVGGGKTFEQSLKAVRIGGTISVIGVLSGVAANLNLLPILMQQVRLQGIIVGSRDNFEALNRALATAELRPVLDERRFAFDQAAEALAYMEGGGHFGKIALTPAG